MNNTIRNFKWERKKISISFIFLYYVLFLLYYLLILNIIFYKNKNQFFFKKKYLRKSKNLGGHAPADLLRSANDGVLEKNIGVQKENTHSNLYKRNGFSLFGYIVFNWGFFMQLQRMSLNSWIYNTQLCYFKSFIKFKIMYFLEKKTIWNYF